MHHIRGFFGDGVYMSAWWFPGTRTVNARYSDEPDKVHSFDICGFKSLEKWALMGGGFVEGVERVS